MSNVTLDLTQDELVQIVGTLRAKLCGLAPARTSVERKLTKAWRDAFGVEQAKILTAGFGDGWVSSDVLQSQLDKWRKAQVDVEGAQTFIYHGVERVVKVENIDSKKRLLSGVELLRDGKVSNQFKHFKLAEIG